MTQNEASVTETGISPMIDNELPTKSVAVDERRRQGGEPGTTDPVRPILTESAMGTLAMQLGSRRKGAPPMTFDVVYPTLEDLERFVARARELGADFTEQIILVAMNHQLLALSVAVPAHLGGPT